MIDFAKVQTYKENNRIEAKKALGGLPRSIWETYSAFANTLGGIILLGVEEHKDKTLHPVDLPDPEMLIQDFWDIINNTNKVSVNILSDKDVTVEKVDGKSIVAIRVPRARRGDKPVFIDGNPFSGSYRRNGEGDYRCTQDDVQSMIRDSEIKSRDMTVLEGFELDAFDTDSIKRYRLHMRNCRPSHPWEEDSDIDFLYKIGAIGKGSDGIMHPTAAGLLMFGYEYEIVKEYPTYLLDYREQPEHDSCLTDRMMSSSGDWSGNIYDFYMCVNKKITDWLEDLISHNGESVQMALCEALANCLINADYYGRQGVVVFRKRNTIAFSNPGGFRIDVETAKSGGVSDPRNGALTKMFNLIDVGNRTGSGIPNMFNVWKKQGWTAPVITESFDPDRITLLLVLGNTGSTFQKIKSKGRQKTTKTVAYREAIVAYLTENVSAGCSELSALIGISNTRTRTVLNSMIADEVIIADGENKNRIYKLKA